MNQWVEEKNLRNEEEEEDSDDELKFSQKLD
jgi:hypothetical protein